MNTEAERLAMFRDCLIAVAPVFARYSVRKLETVVGDVYDPAPKSEAVAAQRRNVASETADLAAQLALHLASKYANVYEAVAPETQDATETRLQEIEARFEAQKDPVKKVQRGQT